MELYQLSEYCLQEVIWLGIENMGLETDINSNPEYSTHSLNYLRQITNGVQRIMSLKMEKM